jgi:hypothetical protein
MSKKRKEPTWRLDDSWGVATDPYNWVLMHRSPGAKSWAAKGYYPNPEMLLKSFAGMLALSEPADPDLVRHLEHISERAQSCAARLNAELEAFIWRDLRRPTAPQHKSY